MDETRYGIRNSYVSRLVLGRFSETENEMVEVYDQDQDAEFITGIQFEDGMTVSEILGKLNDSQDYALDAMINASRAEDEELRKLGTVVWLERAMQVSVFSGFPLLAEVEVHVPARDRLLASWMQEPDW